MTATADDEAIRDAYRRLARVHHPDVAGGSPTAMARLNEAYRVLGDPARRAVYDASLRVAADTATSSGSAAGGGAATAATPAVRVAARPIPASASPVVFPWRFCLVMAAIGAAVVLVIAAMATNAPSAPPVDDVLSTGDCVVVIETDRSVREVACDERAVFQVRSIVALGRACPARTEGYRTHPGTATACIANIVPADD